MMTDSPKDGNVDDGAGAGFAALDASSSSSIPTVPVSSRIAAITAVRVGAASSWGRAM